MNIWFYIVGFNSWRTRAAYKIAGPRQHRPIFWEFPLDAVLAGLDLPPGSDRLPVLLETNDKGHT